MRNWDGIGDSSDDNKDIGGNNDGDYNKDIYRCEHLPAYVVFAARVVLIALHLWCCGNLLCLL